MGMAASQARLLTITARLADNELRSQTINNAKMRLAAQSSRVSENYINALNNATLKFSNFDDSGNALSQNLTYNALTAYSSYNNQYGLVNSAGLLLVNETDAANFANANGNLNAFLQSYGLSYTTTYFDELGAIKNNVYPAPFNNISPDELKSMYEAYGSYESSIEVQNYENAYYVYDASLQNLQKAGSEALLNVFKTNTLATVVFNQNGIVEDADQNISLSGLSETNTLDANVQLFLNAFTSTDNTHTNVSDLNHGYNNLYNLNNLVELGLISEEAKDMLKSTIDYKSYPVSGDPATGGIIWGANTTPSAAVSQRTEILYQKENNETSYKDETTGETVTVTSEIYKFEDGVTVTVDSNGKVTGYTLPSTEISNVNPNLNVAENSYDLETFMSLLQLQDVYTEGEQSYTDCYKYQAEEVLNSKGEYETHFYREYLMFDNSKLMPNLINSTENLLSEITTLVNYEKFVKLLEQNELFKTLCSPDTPLESMSGETLSELATKYTVAKNDFFGKIFSDDKNYPVTVGGKEYASSLDYIISALDNNDVAFYDENNEPVLLTAKDLTDIDFVLKVIKEKGLKQSESFNTIIKEYLIDNLIAEYGEPKYAWVDENDTTNSGNADAKAQWYTNLFNRMNQGYKTLENGLCASKEWIEYALEAGIVSLEQVDKNFKWNGLNYKTCTKIIEETDDAAVTKAEAEYNRAMNDIEAKDNIYTLELKNIDTEHTALQQEYDVIKGVIDKNISRTFKFNQSA